MSCLLFACLLSSIVPNLSQRIYSFQSSYIWIWRSVVNFKYSYHFRRSYTLKMSLIYYMDLFNFTVLSSAPSTWDHILL